MCTNPLIIVYDKGGTVEVYVESFKLIDLFSLLLLHVSIIFETSNLLMYIQKYKEWARSPCNGTIFLVCMYVCICDQFCENLPIRVETTIAI